MRTLLIKGLFLFPPDMDQNYQVFLLSKKKYTTKTSKQTKPLASWCILLTAV